MDIRKLQRLAGISITESYDGPGYVVNIEKETIDNKDYRRVLFTAEHCQLVLMNIAPSGEIGEETHKDIDQFIRIEKGTGNAIINGKRTSVKDGSAIIIPAGSKHNIVNASKTEPLKLYTVYSPAHHQKDVVVDKKQNEKPEEFDGKTDV